jgi:hypothetical protein
MVKVVVFPRQTQSGSRTSLRTQLLLHGIVAATQISSFPSAYSLLVATYEEIFSWFFVGFTSASVLDSHLLFA